MIVHIMPDHSPHIYDHMQEAVDIVAGSAHPTNKIAATIAGDGYALSFTNYWPPGILEKIGTETRIGNSSGTIHAETACLIKAPVTKGAAMFVTDPPCPNCIKNMAEAGIYRLYIDHKGFDKDFAQRRGEDFRNLSLHMCEKAAIDIYKIYRREKRVETIFKTPEYYKPPIENPAVTEKIAGANDGVFKSCIEKMQRVYRERDFALTLTRGPAGEFFMIAADAHPMPGYTSDTLEETGEKYSLILHPLNRVTMTAARKGFIIEKDFVFSRDVPTARGLVNLVGMSIPDLTIQNFEKARDPSGLQALRQLENAGILKIQLF
ncbi:MAG: deaminase [Alphaproteobacteria bacterium]